MKASDLFLESLAREGVEVIFGVPGEENADLMISLLHSPISFVITRHEQGAAFMADVYGRLTGRPGVCLGTLGPGATNLTTGVGNAHFDRSPLVVITGQGSTRRLHKESHQAMDVVDMFRPITKWATTVRRAENIPEVIGKAFKLASMEKPGACHIELPEDIASSETTVLPAPAPHSNLRRPAPDHKAVDRAMEVLAEAKRPIILAGNGCVRRRASHQLRRFAEATGIMVAHTFMGKGALDDRHPGSLLTAGLGSRDHVTEAFEQADVVLAIGYDMIEWPPDHWNPGMDKRIVHIDFAPSEVDNHYRCEVEVIADIAATLWEINERLDGSLHFEEPLFRHLRDHMLGEIGLAEFASTSHDDLDDEAVAAVTSDAFPLKPQRIIADLRQLLGEEDILISDVGAHKMWVARHYAAFRPNTCIISNGFCSMGIALPGAIAAKMVLPERRVVGLCGDGGFLMNLQELATAVQYKVPAVIVVWEDGGYGLIEWKQRSRFGRSSHVHFANPDLEAVSTAFGAHAVRVRSADHFSEAMEQAFAETERPSVIVVPVDYSENLKLSGRLGRLLAH